MKGSGAGEEEAHIRKERWRRPRPAYILVGPVRTGARVILLLLYPSPPLPSRLSDWTDKHTDRAAPGRGGPGRAVKAPPRPGRTWPGRPGWAGWKARKQALKPAPARNGGAQSRTRRSAAFQGDEGDGGRRRRQAQVRSCQVKSAVSAASLPVLL
ncbi:unnamed protein product [Calypogeia fissa]